MLRPIMESGKDPRVLPRPRLLSGAVFYHQCFRWCAQFRNFDGASGAPLAINPSHIQIYLDEHQVCGVAERLLAYRLVAAQDQTLRTLEFKRKKPAKKPKREDA